MKIESLYDKVSETYNEYQSAEILTKSNNIAFQLITSLAKNPRNLLSLGCGDGLFLKQYKDYYDNLELFGLDISLNMLKKAKINTNCHIIHSSISDASKNIPNMQFDLIAAHFVAAYESLTTIFNQANSLLNPSGFLTLTSNTLNSFPKMMELFRHFKKTINPYERIIGNYIQKTLSTVYVPQDKMHFVSLVENSVFKIRELRIEKLSLELTSKQDIYDFFIKGGWFVSGFNQPFMPDILIEKIIKGIISKHIKTPYIDTIEVLIAILEK